MKEILAIIAGAVSLFGFFFNPKAVKRRRKSKYKKKLTALDYAMIKARAEHNEALYNQLLLERDAIIDEMELLGL